jgi:hypothetical protein
MRNTALLEATMQDIIDHPELHNQGVFFENTECGTAMCFAGNVCDRTGWMWDRNKPVAEVVKQGVRLRPDFAAMRELGLTAEEATVLFESINTREMLELMVKDLVNGDRMRGLDVYAEATGVTVEKLLTDHEYRLYA